MDWERKKRRSPERDLIKAIDDKRLFDEIMPAIREAIKHGGSDGILRKSEPLAAAALAKAAYEGDVKAATEILNRVSGKPVERSINVYGDISRMNERDVDQQIMQLLNKTGAQKLLETTLELKPTKKIRARKPRKSDPLGHTLQRNAEGLKPSAETTASRTTEEERTS